MFSEFMVDGRQGTRIRKRKLAHWKSDFKKLKSGQSHSINLKANDIYKIKNGWNTMKFLMTIDGSDQAKLTLKKLSEKDVIAAENNLHFFEKGHWFQNPRVDVNMKLIGDLSSIVEDMKLIFKLEVPNLQGEKPRKPASISIEKDVIVQNLTVSVDGKKINRKEAAKPDTSKKKTLKQGDTQIKILDLVKWFLIPKKWKKIDIKLKRFHPAIYKTDPYATDQFVGSD